MYKYTILEDFSIWSFLPLITISRHYQLLDQIIMIIKILNQTKTYPLFFILEKEWVTFPVTTLGILVFCVIVLFLYCLSKLQYKCTVSNKFYFWVSLSFSTYKNTNLNSFPSVRTSWHLLVLPIPDYHYFTSPLWHSWQTSLRRTVEIQKSSLYSCTKRDPCPFQGDLTHWIPEEISFQSIKKLPNKVPSLRPLTNFLEGRRWRWSLRVRGIRLYRTGLGVAKQT